MRKREFDLEVIHACLLQCNPKLTEVPTLSKKKRADWSCERLSESEISQRNAEYFRWSGRLSCSLSHQYSFFA